MLDLEITTQVAAKTMRVRPLLAADVGGVAELLARALHSDPGFAFLLPDPQRRLAGLVSFFTGNLRLHLPYRCSYVACDQSGALLGTVTLRPAGGVEASAAAMLRAGLLPFARQNGPLAVRRLLWLKSSYDAIETQASRGKPHRLVHMMAVRPERQGRGYGGRLLGCVLEQAERERLPAFLTTHSEVNVRFYRQAGFDVHCERMLVPPGSAPYTVWTLRRLPIHTHGR